MRQILLHPGFHKTGTSAIQHFLWVNRDALAPHFDLRMVRHFKPVAATCAKFSNSNDPLDLLDLVGQMDAALLLYPTSEQRDLLISCKGFSGHLPCNPTVPDYRAMPVLMTYLSGYLADRFPDSQVKVLFTTRDARDWLFSMYRQQLRSRRLTDDFETFAATYANAADFTKIVTDVAAALDPLPVMFIPLEDATRHPLGPGAAIVDQMNVPAAVRRKLTPVGRDNEGPDDALWQQFVDLNRSSHSDRHVAMAKTSLAEDAGIGGWKKP